MRIECIVCPRGCVMEIEKTPSGEWDVRGAACARGVRFGVEEVRAPRRMLTSTLFVEGGEVLRVSVRSRESLPKELLFSILESLRGVVVRAPIDIGDILVKNVGGTGVDLIATSRVERKHI